MQRWTRQCSVALLWLLLACGPLPLAQPYSGPVSWPDTPPPIPPSAPTFAIDEGYGIHIPYGAFGITANQDVWSLAWLADGSAQEYSGDVYGPQNSILYGLAGNVGSDAQHTQVVASHHLHFDVLSPPNEPQRIAFAASNFPLNFQLFIRGEPAARGQVVFASGMRLATVDVVPFRLVNPRQVARTQAIR
ncbi:MAG: hypothetical protein JNJ46_00780 [Myxococcales bacterium]|nr:hypothetical protein [Myxococcales bacterium]